MEGRIFGIIIVFFGLLSIGYAAYSSKARDICMSTFEFGDERPAT